MNNAVFIPSNGIGEIYLDILDMHWYIYNSSCFNLYKEIPFFKLLLDMASLRMRYYMPINSNRLLALQTLLEIGRVSTYLIKSFITIKSLSEDLFCTGDTEMLDYCIEVYKQFVNCEPLDFFLADKWEIVHALKKMRSELFNFKMHLEGLFMLIFRLLQKKSKFENLPKTEKTV